MRKPALGASGNAEAGTPKSGMIHACQLFDDSAGCGMRIAFRGSARVRPSSGSSAIPSRPSSRSPGGQKGSCGTCGRVQRGWYDRKHRRIRDLACGDLRIYLDVEVRRVACRRCGTVKQERLAFLADNPFHTKPFAFYVGRRCRASRSGTWPRSCGSTGTP